MNRNTSLIPPARRGNADKNTGAAGFLNGPLLMTMTLKQNKGREACVLHPVYLALCNRQRSAAPDTIREEILFFKGSCGMGSLTLLCSPFNDTLLAEADNSADFRSFFQPWLAGLFHSADGRTALNILSIKLIAGASSDPGQILWIKSMVDRHNKSAPAAPASPARIGLTLEWGSDATP